MLAAIMLVAGLAQAAPPSADISPEQRRRLDTVIAEKAALKVMDEFLQAFNARDLQAWRATLHYPHVRIASGGVAIAMTPEEYGTEDLFGRLAASGWHHSRWTDMHIVQSGPEKVHVAVRFTRFDANDVPLASFDSLYVITLQGGRWGVIARSSFAP